MLTARPLLFGSPASTTICRYCAFGTYYAIPTDDDPHTCPWGGSYTQGAHALSSSKTMLAKHSSCSLVLLCSRSCSCLLFLSADSTAPPQARTIPRRTSTRATRARTPLTTWCVPTATDSLRCHMTIYGSHTVGQCFATHCKLRPVVADLFGWVSDVLVGRLPRPAPPQQACFHQRKRGVCRAALNVHRCRDWPIEGRSRSAGSPTPPWLSRWLEPTC